MRSSTLLLAVTVAIAATASAPVASAMKCEFGIGPFGFSCEGDRCAAGVVPTPYGVAWGCLAWDDPPVA